MTAKSHNRRMCIILCVIIYIETKERRSNNLAASWSAGSEPPARPKSRDHPRPKTSVTRKSFGNKTWSPEEKLGRNVRGMV